MTSNPNDYAASVSDVKPHAYDPYRNPELFAGVLSRRFFAFLIDVIIISVPIAIAALLVVILGIVTFGLGFALLWPLHAGAIIWAVLYYGFTLGGSASAAIGMRVMNIEMRTWYGAPAYFVLGVVHAIAFWVSVSMLTPFIVLIGLFNARKRLLHDMLLGTVIVNAPARAAQLAPRR